MQQKILNYTQCSLDRANARRHNQAWLEQQLSHPDAQLIPIWQELNLISSGSSENKQPAMATLSVCSLPAARLAQQDIYFLGLKGKTPYFCMDVSNYDEQRISELVDGQGEFQSLRTAGPCLTAEACSLLAYATGLNYWHLHHRFCGKCGAKSISGQGGNMRRCSNPDCRYDLFPKISPAVIMLVEKPAANGQPAQCLLGRQKSWPAGLYSTLAGFVDVGETLEDAVKREVFEEAGIRVDSITYLASQPWPFPSSLMLGFTATAVTDDINLDPDEIEDARWFTAEELTDDSSPLYARLFSERHESIAAFLISQWLESLKKA